MYQFETEAHKNAYIAAMNSGAIQHLSVRIFDAGGTEIEVSEDDILDTPSIDSRCIADESIFNIGEMYVGEAKLKIKNENVRAQALIGGELRMTFFVEAPDYGRISVPLGVWDIKDAVRDTPWFIEITGNDHIGRLSTPVGDTSVGSISLETILNVVSQAANVSFAQTAEEIKSLFVLSGSELPIMPGRCTRFESTCWEEVQMIAIAVCGFAVANRNGEIEFRRFGTLPVASVSANRRFGVGLKECNFGIVGVSYAGGDVTRSLSEYETSSVLSIPRTKYIWQYSGYSEYYEVSHSFLNKLYTLDIVPGTVDTYGDPALDLGDMIRVTDGINSGKPSSFLITGNFWQFRAPQTLSSGGAPTIGQYVSVTTTQGSSSTPTPSYGGGGSAVAKTINVAELAGYAGTLFPTERTVARARFSCRDDTAAFISCTLILCGTAQTDVRAYVYINGEKQPVTPTASVSKGRYTTIAVSLEASLRSGMHVLRITAEGAAELTEVVGFVYGQDIRAETLTYSSDYEYAVADEAATITGYTGDETQLEIPEKLGGVSVKTIDGFAFTENSSITSVYIPEGVEEIG